jgi:hypothetical protein
MNTTTNQGAIIQTRGVLAGAYKSAAKSMLKHAVECDANGYEVRVLCDRVDLDSIVDSGSGGLDLPVTCPVCKRRDPRPTK